VVATASLELGIDMGAVDLVIQVESPGSVARALQRVGRAGHLVGGQSKGRLVPKIQADLLEQAALAREMAAGRVEAVQTPRNCLDVLAQQLVALAAMDDWQVPDLYSLVRRAYPFRDLSPQAFETVVEMITGRYRFVSTEPVTDDQGRAVQPGSLEALHPRASWDRVHNRLRTLPGSQSMALQGGGTIPDTGQYATYTHTGVRIGELDEEFIYERRIGDVFLLGTNSWRVDQIEADRVLVVPAEGAPAMVPFWRGESVGRTHDLGLAIGALLRELAERIDSADCQDWLQRECFLDRACARNLRQHITRQLLATGSVPTDQTPTIEASRDQLGDWQVLFLSPLGARLHLGLRLAIENRLRQRLGYNPQCAHHNDGILVRLTDTEEPVLDLLAGITPENVEDLVLEELADSALFALRFRQNAARALLMPRGSQGRRAPLWLQRLRGRDLLQVARRHRDFPIVIETFRECLHDHLDIPHLQQLLADIRDGKVRVATRRAEAPSPFAAGLLFAFQMQFMYQYDGVEVDGQSQHGLDRQLLEQLIAPQKGGHLLDPRAVHQVERRLRGLGQPPRSATEMAEWLRRLGDLADGELEGPMAGFLEQLHSEERVVRLELPRVEQPCRWVCAEEVSLYHQAFGLTTAEPTAVQEAGATILARFLATHALVGLDDLLRRYPFEPEWATRQLQEWPRTGRAVMVQSDPGASVQYSAPANLEQVQRGSLTLLRREILTCQPPQFVDFLLRWQHAHPETRRGSSTGLAEVLDRLQGFPLAAELWEQTVLPARVPEYQPRWLDEWIAGGTGAWVCQGSGDRGPGQLAFLARETLRQLPPPTLPDLPALGEPADRMLDCLRNRGAMFLADLAADTGLSPGVARAALWMLLRRSLVTNDRFDVIRRGEEEPAAEPAGPRSRLPALRSPRRAATTRPEGRWSLLPWGQPDPESLAILQATLLLQRYGVAARELALLDPWLLPWRVLYEVLSRMELAGDVRRGYFVEGLSGAQFALPVAAAQLQELHLPSTVSAPLVLLHSLDPANLYGAGAPLDVPLLDGGTRPFLRRPGNWLVLRAGRPVLLIEQQGKKLTALASASRDDVLAATACLPGILDRSRGAAVRHKLTVEEWNGQPVTASAGQELLEAAGFVRDYQGMTLYAVWR
jgi:ATP-dependent Lhr-like helicase